MRAYMEGVEKASHNMIAFSIRVEKKVAASSVQVTKEKVELLFVVVILFFFLYLVSIHIIFIRVLVSSSPPLLHDFLRCFKRPRQNQNPKATLIVK